MGPSENNNVQVFDMTTMSETHKLGYLTELDDARFKKKCFLEDGS